MGMIQMLVCEDEMISANNTTGDVQKTTLPENTERLSLIAPATSVTVSFVYPVPDTSGDGVLFSIDFFLCLFVSFFVSLLASLRENGRTDLHEIFGEGAE